MVVVGGGLGRWCYGGRSGLFEAFEVCQNVQGLGKVKRDQTERCVRQKGKKKRSNVCWLDVGEHLH